MRTTLVEHFLPDNSAVNRRVRILFVALLVVGLDLRLVSSVLSQGFVCEDEHQQYLEVAQGLVYGPHVGWWEYERGIRHFFYPSCLALLLSLLDLLSVRDPLCQVTIIRALLGSAILAGIALPAADWLRRGRTRGAFCLLALAALSPDIIYMSIRTLSETAATIPFVLSLYMFKRNPFLTGLLLGIMFSVRFQTAFFIPGFVALSLCGDWSAREWRRGSTWRLAAGLAISLLASGLMDRLTWGGWFHSPRECFKANINEGIAARYGVSAWYQYLDWGDELLAEALPVLGFILTALGMLYEWQLTFVGLGFLIGHLFIDHKIERFLWPLAPIMLLLLSAGFETAYRWSPGRWGRAIFVIAFSCCLAGGSWNRLNHLNWAPEPARSSSLALARVGRYPDVTGVLVFKLPSAECGNYFYLRRDVPLLVNDGTVSSDITAHPLWVRGRINYVITRPKDAAPFARYHLEVVAVVHELGIYKVRRGQAASQ